MKTTLETINQMQADGVIGSYAIGGEIGRALEHIQKKRRSRLRKV